jgi:hypothetical protein
MRGRFTEAEWMAEAEALLGHGLDGDDINEPRCGFSLEEAGLAFEDGMTPQAYVHRVRRRLSYRRWLRKDSQ